MERGSLEKKIKGKGIGSLGKRGIAPCRRLSRRKMAFLKSPTGQSC